MCGKWMSKGTLAVMLIALVIIGLAAFAVPGFAQEGGEGMPAIKVRTVWENLKAGGWTELWIILISVVAFALGIQEYVELRRDRQIPEGLLQELEALIEEQNYEEAVDLCESQDNFLANVMGPALAKAGKSYDRMVDSANEAIEENASIINIRISYLSLIATIEPMLGLLGTVLGMITAFNIIASMKGAANPSDLADSISMALITTATGLIVAIPVLVIYMYLRNRMMRIIQECTVLMGELLEPFKPQ